jgi:hypothetical protein
VTRRCNLLAPGPCRLLRQPRTDDDGRFCTQRSLPLRLVGEIALDAEVEHAPGKQYERMIDGAREGLAEAEGVVDRALEQIADVGDDRRLWVL